MKKRVLLIVVVFLLTFNHSIKAAAPSNDINFTLSVDPSQKIVSGTTHSFIIDLQDNTHKQALNNITSFGNFTRVKSLSNQIIADSYQRSDTVLELFVTFNKDIDINEDVNITLTSVNNSQEVVQFTDLADYNGQPTIKVVTPVVDYYFHKNGGALASLVDKNGNDWITYNQNTGSQGEYRGIPNFVHPEDYFHPGRNNNTSSVVASGKNYLIIKSLSNNNLWEAWYYFFPGSLKVEMVKSDSSKKYWFLYEGTPGGGLDLDKDFYVLPAGEQKSMNNDFDQDINFNPEWVYFGESGLQEKLVLINNNNDSGTDSFYQMQGNMTVFGFGRSGLNKYLNQNNKEFFVFLTNLSDHSLIQQLVLGTAISPSFTVSSSGNLVTPTPNDNSKYDLNDDGLFTILDVIEMVAFLFR